MAWYRSGTVTSVAGTNVITGTGTLWNNPIFGIASGQMIFVPGAGQVVIYEILAVDSDTKIRVTKNISSAITKSEYAIVTTVSNSMSDLARRTAVQLALYQQLLEDWQNITTGTGDVTIIAPDGTEVVIPALSWITDSKTWFDANRELIDNAGNTSGKLALIGDVKTDTNKCAVIVKTGSNANGKYRIWSDGSIDMWGNGIANANGDALVNYPITLPAAAQNVTTTPLLLSTATNRQARSVMVVIDLTTATKATFVVKCSDDSTSADGFYWSVNYAAF
ncbi:gp53-like domain-containing protein [Yersinia enterocolitica]|uniref:gp53-like domain-containing protein n=1 Tax=Yersinia enterocolitica TaxID=630 RepID=UPI003F4886A0